MAVVSICCAACTAVSTQGLHLPATDSTCFHGIVSRPLQQNKGKAILQPVQSDFYTKGFGFFCRQELKMNRAHIPLAVRLGSKEQCDALEGK